MSLKELAAAIYAMPYHKRVERLAVIPMPERGMVKAYMDQMAKRGQDANRRRNVAKACFVPPLHKQERTR